MARARTIAAVGLVAACLIGGGSTPVTAGGAVSVSGRVWDDLDHDGRQDGGESGLIGYTVQLLDDADRVIGETVTNSVRPGRYSITASRPGQYRVRVILPANATASPKDDEVVGDELDSDIGLTGRTDLIDVSANVDDVDAGIELVDISGILYLDRDVSGQQNAGERGVAGVRVRLVMAIDVTQVVAADTTDSYGEYRLVVPADKMDNTLRLKVVLPAGYVPGERNAQVGPLDADGLSAILDLERRRREHHYALLRPVRVGDRVWHDLDRDGRQDKGEPGVAGVRMVLLAGHADRSFGVLHTNAKGRFTWVLPAPGKYRIWFDTPVGATISPMRNDLPEGVDSDIHPRGPDRGYTRVFTVKAGKDRIDIDAGIRLP